MQKPSSPLSLLALGLGLVLPGAALADDDNASAPKASSPIPKPQPIALVQAWLTAYDMDENAQADPAGYGDPEDDPGLKLRRARLGLEGEGDMLRYGVSVGVGSAFDSLSDDDHGVELVDAFVGYAPVQGLWLQAGVMKPPISREQLMSSSKLALAERSVTSEWLTPGRDAGLMVDWKTEGDARVRLRGGGFNGNGDFLGDDNNGKLVAARAEFAYGPSGTYKTWGGREGFTIGVAGDFFYDMDVAVDTMGVGGDMMIKVQGFHFLAEGRMNDLKPANTDVAAPGVLSKTTRWGAFGQVGYAFGPVEPAVRFELFDDDTDVDDQGDLMAMTAGVTGHLLDDHVGVGGGYVMRLETGGRSLANDTARLWMTLAW
ncbi:MAG: hypothetical protein H6742_06655 [Alphaproteobacteria bacterium]|nr:hypothetical protein [Alphaproteobacteria bacterium]